MIAPVVGALPSLVRALSIDLAPLRVNVVAPGFVDTEIRAVCWLHLDIEEAHGADDRLVG